MYRLILLIFSISISVFTQAQNTGHRLSDEEKLAMPAYLQEKPAGTDAITTPPASLVRTAAEWEEAQALVVTYTSYKPILRQIIKYAKEEVRVIVICSDSVSTKNELIADNITDLSNVRFIIAPFNTVWIRDYGQWSIYKNDVDSLYLVDWTYNRPRPKDDTISSIIANYFNYPLYTTTTSPYNLVHTGGNFMTDGLGTSFSSNLVLDENSTKSEQDINNIMEDFMGINRFIKMTNLPYDGIHHIDMHMKLLDEETLLVGEYPQGFADGPQIEANLQYIQNNFLSAFGTPYKLVRIQMPPDQNNKYPHQGGYYRTYTNFVFVNKTVLVPVYQQKYDTTALRILRENLPGYKVIGIDCNSIIPAGGAIHCITKLVHTADPMLIVHQPVEDHAYSATGPEVTAQIQHKTNIASATVYYRRDSLLSYQSTNMIPAGVGGVEWKGTLPAFAAGDYVQYYISANSASGKTQVRPLPAPEGYWQYTILGSAYADGGIHSILDVTGPFPNPASNISKVSVHSKTNLDITIELFDVAGRKVRDIHKGMIANGNYEVVINTERFATGVYILRISNESGSISRKLVVR